MITSFDHVALVVADLPRAVQLFHDVLGFEFVGGGDNPELRVRAIQLRLPGSVKLELLTPLGSDSYLDDYLDHRGEGMHHVAMYVDDVAAAAERLTAAGYGVVDTRTDRPQWHETFLRPSSAFGTLIQLAHATLPWTEPLEGVAIADVLEGRVQVLANVVTWKDGGQQIVPRRNATSPTD